MPYILDAAFLIIIAVCVIVAYNRGFAHTVISFVGTIASAVAAALLSNKFALSVYQKLMEPNLYKATKAKINELVYSGGFYDKIVDVKELLPDFLKAFADNSAYSPEKISDMLAGSAEQAAQSIMEGVIEPLATQLLSMILFFVMFSLFLVAVAVIVKVADKIFEAPVIGGINRFLGGVLGLLQGGVICLAAAVLVTMFVNFTSNSNSYLNQSTVDNSLAAHYFFDYNPVSQLFEE